MRTYSFTNTIAIVNGVEMTAWADGDDVMSVSRRVDSASDKVGVGGEMMVSVATDKSGTIKFKLQQVSPSNKFLNALIDGQEGGSGTFVPIQVRFQDTYRQDLAQGTSGYIMKQPDMVRGEKAVNQEWTIVVESLSMAFGAID